MNFDRNTVIGFVLLALLFFGFFYFNNKEQSASKQRLAIQKAKEDSIAKANQSKPKQDTTTQKKDAAQITPAQTAGIVGQFEKATKGSEQITPLENDLIKVSFTTKGGQIKGVELKKFKDQHGEHVRLASTNFDKINYKIKGDAGQPGDITDFYFTPGPVVKTDSVQIISYTLGDSSGRTITHEFILRKDNY